MERRGERVDGAREGEERERVVRAREGTQGGAEAVMWSGRRSDGGRGVTRDCTDGSIP